MKMFREKVKTIDERIISIQNRIFKEVYFLAAAICIISIVVKTFLYDFDIALVGTEVLIILASGAYYGIRTVILGIYSDETEMYERKSKISLTAKNIIIGLAMGIAIAVLFGVRSSILYADNTNRLWYFVLVFFASFIIYCPLLAGFLAIWHVIAKKLSEKANRKDREE